MPLLGAEQTTSSLVVFIFEFYLFVSDPAWSIYQIGKGENRGEVFSGFKDCFAYGGLVILLMVKSVCNNEKRLECRSVTVSLQINARYTGRSGRTENS